MRGAAGTHSAVYVWLVVGEWEYVDSDTYGVGGRGGRLASRSSLDMYVYMVEVWRECGGAYDRFVVSMLCSA